MVDVVVLGSGTPNPDPDRAGPAVAVVDGTGWLLVDCGRGAALRATTAGLDLRRLDGVLLTHHHSDHVSDLATLATARWAAGATTPLAVHAPEGPAAAFARACLDAYADDCFHGQADAAAGPRPRVAVHPFGPSAAPAPVPGVAGWRVTAARVDHGAVRPACGYRVERAGAVVVVSGDTRVCDGVRTLAAGAHVLVHQALLADRVRPALLTWNASAESVGALAAQVRPMTLVLTHLIPAPVTPADEEAYRADVRRGGFDGRTVVARDLLRVTVDVPG